MTNLLRHRRVPNAHFDAFPTYLQPLFVFVLLQQIVGKKFDDALQDIGAKFGAQLMVFLQEHHARANNHKIVTLLLDQLSYFGLGSYKIMQLGEVSLIRHESTVERQYRVSFPDVKEPKALFSLGILQGALAQLMGKRASASIAETMMQGRAATLHTVRLEAGAPAKLYDVFSIHALCIKDAVEYDIFIEQIRGTGHLMFRSGRLQVWNIACLNMPFGLIDAVLFAINARVNDIVGSLAFIQTQAALTFQRQKFGVTGQSQNLNRLFKQQEMILGIFGSIEQKEKQMLVQVSLSVSFEQMRNRGESITLDALPYTRALLMALATAVLEKNVVDIVASDEVITLHLEDTDPVVPVSGFESMIIEKTKPKYFLT